MLYSCEGHGFLFRATDEDDSDELEVEVEDVETTQDAGIRLSVVYDKKQTRIDPRPGIR